MALLIALITFAVAIAVCVLIWVAIGADANQDVIRRRMDAVHRAERRGNVDLGVQLVRDEMLSGVPVLNRILMGWAWSTKFRDFLQQAGMNTRPGRILVTCGVLAFGGFLVARSVYGVFPVPIVVAFMAGISPLAYIAIKRRRRLRRFEEHFPEALDLLNRAIRAGHAFTTGMGMIATEAQ